MSMCNECCYTVFQDNHGHRQVCPEHWSDIERLANAHGPEKVVRRNGAEDYDYLGRLAPDGRDRGGRFEGLFPGFSWIGEEFEKDQEICDGSAPESYDEVKVGRVYL
ncbi:hypothetical protein CEP52_016938 [Fusarium oligoseptatum]|uniref:Uncharacterized protein n=1 Tax=Fusarium oligoseptatum TaxID=2604345 RepID=A0A428RYD1_9HYPO|nr:hypothetical protein CEP52_016938 [Fusarium oligoseptatum]